MSAESTQSMSARELLVMNVVVGLLTALTTYWLLGGPWSFPVSVTSYVIGYAVLARGVRLARPRRR